MPGHGPGQLPPAEKSHRPRRQLIRIPACFSGLHYSQDLFSAYVFARLLFWPFDILASCRQSDFCASGSDQNNRRNKHMGFVPYSSPESIELYPISDGELKHTGIKRIKWIFYESWGIKKNYIFLVTCYW
jgi:hypothetical protein